MRAVVGMMAVLLIGCQGQREPAVEELTEARQAEIEAEVRQVVEEEWAAAREVDAERMLAHASQKDGLCVWGTTIYSCKEVWESYREAWRPEREQRLERQEMDGLEIQVMALSPTVALVATTIEENRAYMTTGEVRRASFALFFVYVLEDDGWKAHSGQQAGWPIEEEEGS